MKTSCDTSPALRPPVREPDGRSRAPGTGGSCPVLAPAAFTGPPAFRALLLCAFLLTLAGGVRAQFLEIKQEAMLINTNFPGVGLNLQSKRGVPLSSTPANPVGSDGRAPGLPAPTPNQFQGLVSFGGLTRVPTNSVTNLNPSLSFIANATNLNLSRVANANGQVLLVLRAAQVGAPFLARQVSFQFGSVITPPVTDENGILLTNNIATYWQAQPHSTNNFTAENYYWSPFARKVYANQAGPVTIVWKKSTGTLGNTNDLVNYVNEGNFFYRIYTQRYVVSAAAVKPTRRMYWTEGTFAASTGYPISVSAAQVGAVNVVYNFNFPQYVATQVLEPGEIVQTPTTNTLWFDTVTRQIRAHNKEGRVFVELLGDSQGGVRTQLGFEIVDVVKQPTPDDVTGELGEPLKAYPDGSDDSALTPVPINRTDGQVFHFRHSIQGGSRVVLYGTRKTSSLNDLLVHWLEEGEQGLKWPAQYSRYALIWPVDVARYSHYVRPVVNSEADAKLTAVPLPLNNIPEIPYQDDEANPRGKLTDTSGYYTWLTADYPAHRALLKFSAGEYIAYERVFSWLDVTLRAPAGFTNSVATGLSTWSTNTKSFNWTNQMVIPRLVYQNVNVGDRLIAPDGEAGSESGEAYLAGHIRTASGTSYLPAAYKDPYVVGLEEAQFGAIIPVNAIPGNNRLEVWWFRSNGADVGKGFSPAYWPSVIGHYTNQWPANPREIVLASNDGSGGLPSLEATGSIYYENNPAMPGYNPNEEHALMLGGQAYALRDDLNRTAPTVPAVLGSTYSSDPFVLLSYTEEDGRPAVSAFKVLREKASTGQLFDYVVEAGTLVQAPMPLPLMEKPVELNGQELINYNTEPPDNSKDLPVGWTSAQETGLYPHYSRFTYEDRKNQFWVYRGLHAGLPALASGAYVSTNNTFTNLPIATAVVNQPFKTYVHASRRLDSLTMTCENLPQGLDIVGLTITGTPQAAATHTLSLVITDVGDGSMVVCTQTLRIVNAGAVTNLAALSITSTNKYSGTNVTYTTRPPHLAVAPGTSNTFTMQFYYKTLAGFAWPGRTDPGVGKIVPWLLPLNSSADPTAKTTYALPIVYRPVWPATPPALHSGETLADPKNGLAGVRGQSSVELIYQQSLGLNITGGTNATSAVLHDATREKSFDIRSAGLTKLPASVRTSTYQGKTYFPNLPPHLAQRFFFDPNRGTNGHLVFKGQFKDEITGEDYLLLNVLRGSDLLAVKQLCDINDDDKNTWYDMIDGLATVVETFYEDPDVPKSYIPDPDQSLPVGIQDLAAVTSSEVAVDSYALSASGPANGYITYITGNGRAFTPEGDPISVYVVRVTTPLTMGELKVIPSSNPLSELLTVQHTPDLAGKFSDYQYDWRIGPPVDGNPPEITPAMNGWTVLASGSDLPRYTLGGAGVQVLTDNYITLRYRAISSAAHPANTNWTEFTTPVLAEGWIKRVLAGINPFNQRVTDLYNNTVNTDASLLTAAGKRWEGDIALNLENINNYGLIEIYETVLRRGKMLTIDSGINYGPANDALLLAAGYINDLYIALGNEAYADAANPTIGIGTKDQTYGDIATALFAFKGQVASVLDEEAALLRGRDDFFQPGVQTTPVYNRLVWNYTRGIDAGEVIYALNYNIYEKAGGNGAVNAADAAALYPQGHGDAYGHYLTALKGYYELLVDPDFDWVPRIEAVNVLGLTVSVDYQDERKFAAAAAAVGRTGRQIFDLAWRQDYKSGGGAGWQHFSTNRVNTGRTYSTGATTNNVTRYWGMDHWASRVGQGNYVHWLVGNAILPDVDPDPSHEGIQRIDRTTVTELQELVTIAKSMETSMDNAEAGLNPLGMPESSVPFDLDPNTITGTGAETHFEQVYSRAKTALRNALVAFDEAKDVTRQMRTSEDSLAELQASILKQELAYTNALIEIYGTPYTDDIGPGKTYVTGYAGPDYIHYSYVDVKELAFGSLLNPTNEHTFKLDVQTYPEGWSPKDKDADLNFLVDPDDDDYENGVHYVEYTLGSHGFFGKPGAWTGRRSSPGQIQDAVSKIIVARNLLYSALDSAENATKNLNWAADVFAAKKTTVDDIRDFEKEKIRLQAAAESVKFAAEMAQEAINAYIDTVTGSSRASTEAIPKFFVAGLASGGDLTSPARSGILAISAGTKAALLAVRAVKFGAMRAVEFGTAQKIRAIDYYDISERVTDQQTRELLFDLGQRFDAVQNQFPVINQRLQEMDDAERKYLAAVASAERIQAEREIFRQRCAALIQGYRTRDAAFRLFRNEKLERYQTLFALAARYSYLAAKAYDYETGQLGSTTGKNFLNRIVQARALGVVRNGEPQYAGSNTGDPGLSSALAEMKADWDVLKGRLGFNNPDAYGTTMSLRSENFRILPGTDGNITWRDVLNNARKANILTDADVKRQCLQIDPGNGLPVPGLVIEFSTTIADGFNFFGQPLAAGDHTFNPASFATKVFSVGIALEGYVGMDSPVANSGAVTGSGGATTSDPNTSFLTANGLAATPYVYLIPVGVDSMRSPPLGDVSTVRTWSVDDVSIPLPFNLGASDFSTKALWNSADSLTEPLFSIRKHQSFRPVPTKDAFSPSIYGPNGGLLRSQFTNNRLIGRSVWNSKWKLVIPGKTLLNNPDEGLERFLNTVTDVKLHFVTYSYSGN